MRVFLLLVYLMPLVQDRKLMVTTAALCRSLLAAGLSLARPYSTAASGGYLCFAFFFFKQWLQQCWTETETVRYFVDSCPC